MLTLPTEPPTTLRRVISSSFARTTRGYDERILTIVDHKISLGNYVLTGGELPALILIDSISRLLPGVLGGETSALIESFSDGDNLEYPQYTKPADFCGLKVPEILLSGDHGKIAAWRAEHSGHKTNSPPLHSLCVIFLSEESPRPTGSGRS